MCVSSNSLKKARDLVKSGDLESSLALFLEILPNLDKNTLEYALAISEIGSVYFALKDIKNAQIWDEKFHQICLERFKSEPEIWRDKLAQSYSNLAFLNLGKNEFESALNLIDEALKLDSSDEIKLQKAGILKSILNSLFNNGNLKVALNLNEMLIELIESIDQEFLANQLFFNAILKYLLKDDDFLISLNKSLEIAKNLELDTTKQDKFLAKIFKA